ncbi:ATP-binding cassette domain-containing protein [Candidatus Mycoplasma pogonae]
MSQIFRLSLRHKWMIIGVGIISCILSLLTYLPSLILQQIIAQKDVQIFLYILSFFIGIIISRSVFAFLNTFFIEKIKARIKADLKTRLVNNFLKQNYSIFEKTNSESLAFSTEVNIKNYVDNLMNAVISFTIIITSLGYTFIFIAIQSWILFTFVILAFLLWAISTNIFTPKVKRKNRELKVLEERYSISFSRLFKNISVSRLLQRETFLKNKINDVKADFITTKNSFALIRASWIVFARLMIGIIQLGMIILAFYLSQEQMQGQSGAINQADFISIIFISGMLVGPIFAIADFLTQLTTATSALKTLQLKTKDWKLKVTQRQFIELEKIEFKNVSLKRFDDPNLFLFKNINQVIQKGDFVKVEGPSGSGKTTFLSLLFNENSNYSGSIIFNNTYKNNHEIAFQAGLIKQQPSIFPLSIRENILLGETATETEVENLLNKVGLLYLTKRLDDEINLNQTNLSGGELRRIEIARLLFAKPSVLILDEAFVGIDFEEKNKIVQIIKNEFKNNIIIYTSHEDHIQFNNKTIFINQIANKRFDKKPKPNLELKL